MRDGTHSHTFKCVLSRSIHPTMQSKVSRYQEEEKKQGGFDSRQKESTRAKEELAGTTSFLMSAQEQMNFLMKIVEETQRNQGGQ